MASIRKRNGRYQAQVRIGSVSKSASFSSKAEARAWAAGEEAALYSSCKSSGSYTPMNMAEVLLRYMDVISPEKAGYLDELTVIRAMLREDWTSVPIERLGPQHLADYRDRRLKTVKPATFNRQFGIMRHACHVSRTEWGWNFDDGFLGIRMARVKPQSFLRRVGPEQLNSLLKASEFCKTPRMRHIIELAVETGLRRGEICSLNVADVDLDSGLLHVRQTKNGHPRSVPLSLKTVELGFSSKGKSISSAVLVQNEDAVIRQKVTRGNARDLRTFHEAAAEHNGVMKIGDVVVEKRGSLENWRQTYNARAIQDNPEAKRKAFERARKSLVERGFLEVRDDIYTLKLHDAGQTGHEPDN